MEIKKIKLNMAPLKHIGDQLDFYSNRKNKFLKSVKIIFVYYKEHCGKLSQMKLVKK